MPMSPCDTMRSCARMALVMSVQSTPAFIGKSRIQVALEGPAACVLKDPAERVDPMREKWFQGSSHGRAPILVCAF